MKLNLVTIYLAAFALAAVFFLVARIFLPTNEVISLGQFIVELLLVPSILLTLIEIRKLQSIPKLDLVWNNQKGENVKEFETPVITNDAKYPTIAIINFGESIALWYVVQIDFLGIRLSNQFHFELRYKIGNDINWQYEEIETDGEVFVRFKFMSNGQYAVYPYSSLQLGVIYPSFSLINIGDNQHVRKIHYKIYSDNAKPSEGVLLIKKITTP